MRRILVLTAIAMALLGCEPSKPTAAQRLAKAEAAMEECKKRTGLADVATPSGVILDDPATHGQPMTPELAGQLRLKVQCRLELDELLAARRPQ